MKDSISHTRLLTLHPNVMNDFKKFIEDAENSLNITLRITQAKRTMAEQQSLYDQGRIKPGHIVTNAKPGASFHNYGLAVDLVRLNSGKADWNYNMAQLLPFAEKVGISWGGNWKKFKDYPHFEKNFGNNWKYYYAKYKNKDFIGTSDYVIL